MLDGLWGEQGEQGEWALVVADGAPFEVVAAVALGGSWVPVLGGEDGAGAYAMPRSSSSHSAPRFVPRTAETASAGM